MMVFQAFFLHFISNLSNSSTCQSAETLFVFYYNILIGCRMVVIRQPHNIHPFTNVTRLEKHWHFSSLTYLSKQFMLLITHSYSAVFSTAHPQPAQNHHSSKHTCLWRKKCTNAIHCLESNQEPFCYEVIVYCVSLCTVKTYTFSTPNSILPNSTFAKVLKRKRFPFSFQTDLHVNCFLEILSMM